MSIGNISVNNGNAGFEHFCGIAERGSCRRIEVGGETRLVREGISDYHAIEIRHLTARRDHRLHVDVAVKSREAAITARLIEEKIGPRKGGVVAQAAALRAVNRNAFIILGCGASSDGRTKDVCNVRPVFYCKTIQGD